MAAMEQATKRRKGMKYSIIFGLFAGVLWTALPIQGQWNHSYPRIATFQFGNRAPASWYAQRDLIIISGRQTTLARKIKELNPNAKVLSTGAWAVTNAGNQLELAEKVRPEWLAVNSKGKFIEIDPGRYLYDPTDFAPKFNGKRYNEYLAEFLIRFVDLSVFDGISGDWTWFKLYKVTDVDFDRNGRNDYDEHGKDWVNETYKKGVLKLLRNIKNKLGPDKVLLVNSGQFHSEGWEFSNGVFIENFAGIYGTADAFINKYFRFMRTAPQPHVLVIDGFVKGNDPNKPRAGKNYFSQMRFGLTLTLLGDGYFEFTDENSPWQHYDKHYDEFDLDLGYPTSDPIQLWNGCWVRFFEKGVSITNPTGSPQRVSDADLRAQSAYNGPYFRFRGGQDPEFNNGKAFTSVRLFGDRVENNKRIVGDGIILLKKPITVVADIIIDNQQEPKDAETSPGSRPARLEGNWVQILTKDADDAYGMRYSLKGLAYAEPGNGEAKAIFTPTIGVPGRYNVYEWHGAVPGRRAATNVTYEIVYGNNKKVTKQVDQTKNRGQWNLLGTFEFPKGTVGKVIITNKANGIVIADAIRFEFVDNTKADENAPNPPTGVKVSTEN